MKSKKLVVFLIVLIFLAVLVVLNSTLFTLQNISINWLTTKSQLESVKDYSIIENIDKGSSIFLVKKNEIASNLEKSYPYLRVVSIETKFPNKIVIHSAERESMFAIKISDNEYAVVDEMAKVLSLRNSSIFAGVELGAKPIKVFLDDLVPNIDPSYFSTGEIVKNPDIEMILTRLAISLRESNYVPTTSKGVFNKISMARTGVNGEVDIKLFTRNGIGILLKDAMNYTTDKFLLAIERYNAFHQEGVVNGTIEVTYNNYLNKIVARYDEKTLVD